MPKIKSGFTLIELLVVIAIIISLASFVVIQFTGARGAARDTRRKSDLRQYQTALEKYANLNNGLYPNNAGANLTSLCTTLGITSQCLDDPGGTISYRYISNGAASYVIYATLEKPVGGVTQYWVICQNGSVGRIPTTGAGAWTPSSTCPNNLQQ